MVVAGSWRPSRSKRAARVAVVRRVFSALAALLGGDLVAARRGADEAVTGTTGYYLSVALLARARVAIAQGEPEQGERDAHDALACAADAQAYLVIPDILGWLDAGSHREAARFFGAAHAIRQRMGAVRFKVFDADYEASVAGLRDAMGEKDFDAAWAEGAALSTEEAIAYAQRGRGERKRPISGWASLTPTERDVVQLVSEGLGNNDIATRLFVSPRTVQTHLTHVYTNSDSPRACSSPRKQFGTPERRRTLPHPCRTVEQVAALGQRQPATPEKLTGRLRLG
jgi:DNA-binding CsgD family transcriptional regulator